MPSRTPDRDVIRTRAARMAADLDPQDRAVLALHYGERLTIGETAALLRMNPDEVRTAVSRAIGVVNRHHEL